MGAPEGSGVCRATSCRARCAENGQGRRPQRCGSVTSSTCTLTCAQGRPRGGSRRGTGNGQKVVAIAGCVRCGCRGRDCRNHPDSAPYDSDRHSTSTGTDLATRDCRATFGGRQLFRLGGVRFSSPNFAGDRAAGGSHPASAGTAVASNNIADRDAAALARYGHSRRPRTSCATRAQGARCTPERNGAAVGTSCEQPYAEQHAGCGAARGCTARRETRACCEQPGTCCAAERTGVRHRYSDSVCCTASRATGGSCHTNTHTHARTGVAACRRGQAT